MADAPESPDATTLLGRIAFTVRLPQFHRV
jgi:hypothetical protein